VFVGNDELHRLDQRLIRGGGAQLQRFDDREQGFTVTPIKFLDEGLIAIPVMGADLFALLQQLGWASFSIQDKAHLRAARLFVFGICTGVYDVRQHLDQVLGDDSFRLAQPFEFLLRLVGKLAHPFEKHLDDLVAGGDDRLIDEASQQREALRSREVQEV